jgi:hypothetical protein
MNWSSTADLQALGLTLPAKLQVRMDELIE